MGLFSFLFGSGPSKVKGPTKLAVPPPQSQAPRGSANPSIQWRPASFPMEVVGESRYQDALVAICGAHTRYGHEGEYLAVLKREPSNAFDPNAIAVHIDGRKVGYLSREQAERVSIQMDEAGLGAVRCSARVRGGWRTNQYDEGHYGVRLGVPTWGWIDLGIGAEKPVEPRKPRRPSITPPTAPNGPLSGERIAIQGAPKDGPLAVELAAAGAKIMAGPGKTTTLFVVAASRPFTYGHLRSSMHTEAVALGLTILSQDEIRDRLKSGSAS